MKTLVIANQKGGVGKTTLLVHLAYYAAEAGSRVLVIDLDPQRNSSSSLDAFACSTFASALFDSKAIELKVDPAARIMLIGADSALIDLDRASLDVAKDFVGHVRRFSDSANFDVCLIDTSPAMGLRMVAALAAANYVMSPIELQAYSINGSAAMLKTIYGIRQKLNPGLQFLGMLPSRVNAHSPAQKANLTALLKKHPDLIMRRAVTERTTIGEASTEKKPVWDSHKTSAREAGKEMKGVLAHIVEKMGGLSRGV